MACTLEKRPHLVMWLLTFKSFKVRILTFPVLAINRTLCWLNERYPLERYRTELSRYTSYRKNLA